MIINKDVLKELKPCTERYKNYLENYADFNGSLTDFLGLDKITYSDKIWVVKLVVVREILEQWAVLCAESVLHIFENKYPNDKRPRECIEYLKTREKNQEKLLLHRWAAAYAAYAAYAATYAATYAADVTADSARKDQQDKNIEFLKQLLKGE